MISRFVFLILLMSSHAFAASGDEELATPEFQPSPAYPDKCQVKLGLDAPPQTVFVTYDVNSEGLPENVRVRESSDPCFEDAVVAAVRRWRFEPRRVNGKRAAQTDLESTFRFELERAAQIRTFDARPIKRIPPSFPNHCQDGANREETVRFAFDVTTEGRTSNIRILETTNSCFNRAATRSVKKWLYEPRVEDGKPVERKNVETMIKFVLAGKRLDPEDKIRPKVRRALNKAGKLIRKEPEQALELVEAVEMEFGDTFTAAESAAFHQIRGYARIGVGDAYGALDDLRIARQRTMSSDTAEAIALTIGKLEEAISNASKSQNEAESKADEAEGEPREAN